MSSGGIVQESAWRGVGRWASQNTHYLGLIALMAGLGMFLVAVTVQGTAVHTTFYSDKQMTKPILFGPGYLRDGDWPCVPAVAGIMLGTVLAVGAGICYRYNQRQAEKEFSTDLGQEAQIQGALKREWGVRALVILASLVLSMGITSCIIMNQTRLGTGYAFGPWESHSYWLPKSVIDTLLATSIPLMIAGGGATVVGFGLHRCLLPKPDGPSLASIPDYREGDFA